MIPVGETIKRLRTEKGITQEELADLVGVRRTTVASWECDVRVPQIETARKLANLFGVPLTVIVPEESQGQEQIAGANQRIVFCENLNRYMRQRGVTQADIVSGLGFSASTVSDWTTGKKYPRVEAMEMLADKLGVQITDLTRSHNEPKEEGANRMNRITLDDLLAVTSAMFLHLTVTMTRTLTSRLDIDSSDLQQWTDMVELYGGYEVCEVTALGNSELGISLTPPRRPEE